MRSGRNVAAPPHLLQEVTSSWQMNYGAERRPRCKFQPFGKSVPAEQEVLLTMEPSSLRM